MIWVVASLYICLFNSNLNFCNLKHCTCALGPSAGCAAGGTREVCWQEVRGVLCVGVLIRGRCACACAVGGGVLVPGRCAYACAVGGVLNCWHGLMYAVSLQLLFRSWKLNNSREGLTCSADLRISQFKCEIVTCYLWQRCITVPRSKLAPSNCSGGY